jgi:hypothetical protein
MLTICCCVDLPVDTLTHYNLDRLIPGDSVFMESEVGICGRDGRATASVRGDGGSIPTGGALEVWPCGFGPKQFGWLGKS